MARLLALPEANVFFFGVLVNFPWELLQIPFFDGMSRAPHWQATKLCSLAAVGDGALLVGAYWVAAVVARSRKWVLNPRLRDVLVLLSVAQVMNALFEWLNTEVWQRWAYIPGMPTVPLLGTGLAPILQWLLLPPLVIWIVRRQIVGEWPETTEEEARDEHETACGPRPTPPCRSSRGRARGRARRP